MPLAAGQILNNRYRIVKLLGQGGFGAVYRAWDLNLKGPCAVKENFDASPVAQAQFEREASLLFNLRHPNLPKVFDSFTLPGQGQYLVMEYIEGEDLGQMLERTGAPLSPAQALPWIIQVCDALHYLHGQTPPIIHRDLKPANIRITPQGQAMLVDFGIAKIYDPNLRTTLGARAVTPGYSPNEQYLSSGKTDARSDIYALGATLYTLFTRQTPPEAPERNMGVALPSIRGIQPSVSPQMEAAVFKAMEIVPDRRYQSAAEMKQAISDQLSAVSGQPSAVSRPARGSVQPTVSSGTVGQSGSGSAGQSGGGAVSRPGGPAALPWKWIAGIGALALVIVIVAVALISSMNAPREVIRTVVVEATRPPGTAVEDLPAPTRTSRLTEAPPPTAAPLPTDTAAAEPGMVLIPAGEFQMGSNDGSNDEKPVHTVYLDAYYIDVYEVTNAMFEQFVQAAGHETTAEKEGWAYAYADGEWKQVNGADWRHPQGPSSNLDGLAEHPVVQVSWEDASAYCEWRGARLPTEAEWEKAARGTDGRVYPWGSEFDAGRVNFCDKNCPTSWADKSADDGYAFTAPVGSYPAGVSPFGLYDMAGNVWEWVMDWYQDTYYSSRSTWNNPLGPSSGQYRVVRGGSWSNVSRYVRSALRIWDGPTNRYGDVGFRCARSP